MVQATDDKLDRQSGTMTTTDLKVIEEIRRAPTKILLDTAKTIIEEKIARTKLFDADAEATIPRFEMSEITLGHVLGRGGFCVIYAIEKIRFEGSHQTRRGLTSNLFSSRKMGKDGRNPDQKSQAESETTSHMGEGTKSQISTLSRDQVATAANKKSRKGGSFVLKQVAKELKQAEKIDFLKGIVDLAMEAKYLAALDHPNIISLCGISTEGSFDFIILERLSETLSRRFKTWMRIDRQCKGITGVFAGSKKKVQELYQTRLKVAYDIASGMDYIHSLGVVFRDLVSIVFYAVSMTLSSPQAKLIKQTCNLNDRNQTMSVLTCEVTSRFSTLVWQGSWIRKT